MAQGVSPKFKFHYDNMNKGKMFDQVSEQQIEKDLSKTKFFADQLHYSAKRNTQ